MAIMRFFFCGTVFVERMPMNISSSILRPETKVVILDLDGTLYDKRWLPFYMVLGDLIESPLLAKERRVRKAMRGKWYGSSEAFYDAFYAAMARHRLCTVSFMRWWYTTTYMPLMVRVLQRHCRPYPWVTPFLQQCRQLGVQVVLLSDYGSAKEKLEALGLDTKLFDWIISAPELGGLKPARQLIDAVTGRMQVLPSQCIVIGDRDDTDGAMARAAGVAFVLVQSA